MEIMFDISSSELFNHLRKYGIIVGLLVWDMMKTMLSEVRCISLTHVQYLETSRGSTQS